MLPFQHPFVSKVTSNRALRELVAEAKAEVMEEIEDRDEAEEEDSSESASVSSFTPLPVLLETSAASRNSSGGCLAREELGFGGCGVVLCSPTGGAGEKG